MRNRSLSLLIVAALLVIPASSSSSFGALALLSAPQVEGYTTMGGTVRVVVSNPASTDQVCTVTVTAVLNGEVVKSSATQSVPAGSSATVSVHASGVPVSVTMTVAAIGEGNEPVGW